MLKPWSLWISCNIIKCSSWNLPELGAYHVGSNPQTIFPQHQIIIKAGTYNSVAWGNYTGCATLCQAVCLKGTWATIFTGPWAIRGRPIFGTSLSTGAHPAPLFGYISLLARPCADDTVLCSPGQGVGDPQSKPHPSSAQERQQLGSILRFLLGKGWLESALSQFLKVRGGERLAEGLDLT